MSRISQNVRYLRDRGNHTKTWVAEQLGKTDSAIASYESGRTGIPVPILEQYADLFDVYIGDIVGVDMWKGESRPPDSDGTTKELERLIRVQGLLHGTIEEKEARLAQLRQQITAQLKTLSNDPAKEGERDRMEELLAILDKDKKG